MRHRVTASFIVVVLVAALTFSIVGMAQAPQRVGGERGAAAGGGRGNATPPPGPPHDPHDLNGVWLQRGGAVNRNPESQWSAQKIPFTPAGQAKFLANKPGKGPRADLPAKGNDPLGGANVPGLLRSLVYGRPFQFITSQDKVVQLFEWFRIWREIWSDVGEHSRCSQVWSCHMDYSFSFNLDRHPELCPTGRRSTFDCESS